MYNIIIYIKYDSKRRFDKILILYRLKALTHMTKNNNVPWEGVVDLSCVKP